MLENEPARKERQGRAIDPFRVDRHDRHPEKIPNRFQEPLLVHLPGVQNLGRPGAAVEVSGKFHRFLSRRHPAGKQQIDKRITGRRIHAMILLEPCRIVMRLDLGAAFGLDYHPMKTLISTLAALTLSFTTLPAKDGA